MDEPLTIDIDTTAADRGIEQVQRTADELDAADLEPCQFTPDDADDRLT